MKALSHFAKVRIEKVINALKPSSWWKSVLRRRRPYFLKPAKGFEPQRAAVSVAVIPIKPLWKIARAAPSINSAGEPNGSKSMKSKTFPEKNNLFASLQLALQIFCSLLREIFFLIAVAATGLLSLSRTSFTPETSFAYLKPRQPVADNASHTEISFPNCFWKTYRAAAEISRTSSASGLKKAFPFEKIEIEPSRIFCMGEILA